jgi:arginyl-tRNA synthetase
MATDKYKDQFARAVAEAFRSVYPEVYQQEGDTGLFDPKSVADGLEAPRDPSMGRYALPVFRYLSLFKAKPQDVTSAVARRANEILGADGGSAVSCVGVSGFLNARIDPVTLARETVTTILAREGEFARSSLGAGKTRLVEYSSPNIAKPFGIGHLRSTILGHSLRRIYKKLGYDVVGLNYPGDWGTQFGKMIVAYEKWGTPNTLEGDAVKNLLDLYVRYHREAKEDPSLDDEARRAFRKLEDGDPEAVELWEKFKEISYAEFDRIYSLLGIEFDWVYGESVLNDRMEQVIERLEKAGLTSISRGALVVDLHDDRLPPLLLKKSDGATLYATRDLAGLIYRWEKYPGFDESLYVVNVAQSDHFKQCFRVIEMLEEAEGVPTDKRMSGRVKHVDFGWVRFEGRMMSTRRGNIVLLEDVIIRATELAKEKILEKNPSLAAIDETAHQIGVGAVIFSQLALRRQRDIDFRWDEVLNFEGETGPYLQYTHARLCSVERRYGQEIAADVDYSLLNQPEEQRVVELLTDFPAIVLDAGEQYEPFFISSHLLKLGSAFNKVYQRKDETGQIDKIISDDQQLTRARMALVKAVQLVVKEGLQLLGIEAPEEM